MNLRDITLVTASALLISLCTLPETARAQAAAPATVKGQITIGDDARPLKYAYVVEVDDVEGARLQDTPRHYFAIRFTDVELPPATARSSWRIASLARAGKVRAVEVNVDPAKRATFGGAIYYARTPKDSPILTITASNSDTYLLKEFKVEGNTVSGTALMANPEKWVQLDDKAPEVTFQYSVEFSAPLLRQPAVTATLTGAQAQSSPQVKALLAYEAVCRKGDIAAARKLAVPETSEEWNTIIAQIGEAQFKKMMMQSAPDARVRVKQITRVVVRGDHATVIYREQGATGFQPMVKKNGAWLVDAP